jgi:exopolysaccharide production protein ExoQ
MQLKRRPTPPGPRPIIPLPARSVIPAPQDQTSDVLRNLLVCGIVFYLFAFTAPDLVFGVSKARGNTASDAGSTFIQLILPAMFFASCIVGRIYRISAQRLWRAVIPMAPFLLVMVLSTLWSDYPELTLRRASRELLEAIALVTLAACFSNPRAMLGVLFRAFLIIGCLDLLSSVIFADSFTDLGFAGIHGNKNVAGEFFVVAIPIYLLGTLDKEISGSRLLALFGLIAGTAMLVATQSKTSAGAIVFGLAALLPARYLFRRHPYLRVSSQLLFLLGLLCAVAVILNWGPGEVLNSLIGDPTLTGRDQIWLYVTQKFNASPILGVGYGAVWQVGPEIEAALKRAGLVFVFNEAHNGYLDIAAQLGVLGVACLVIFLIATLLHSLSYWARIEKNDFRGAGALTIYVFWALVLSNITESLYFQPGVGSSGILIFLGGFVASRNEQLAATSTAKAIPRAPRALRRSIASEA